MNDSPDHYRTVTPYLVVRDADAELSFLQAAFGATVVTCERKADNTIMHAEIALGDSLVMLGQAAGEWKALRAVFYLWVDNVDEVYRKALAAGAGSESAPEDKPYGHRNAGVVDPAAARGGLPRPSASGFPGYERKGCGPALPGSTLRSEGGLFGTNSAGRHDRGRQFPNRRSGIERASAVTPGRARSVWPSGSSRARR